MPPAADPAHRTTSRESAPLTARPSEPDGRKRASLDHFRRALGERDDTLEATRSLFLVLALASGAMVLPQAFLAKSAIVSTLAVASTLVLTLGLVQTYRARYQGWTEEIVEVVALAVFAACATQPAAVLGVLFARIWFRSLYGSRWASVIRPFAYIGALSAAMLLAQFGPEVATTTTRTAIAWSFPIILVTAAIGRQLAMNVHAGAHNARLDAIHVQLGEDVLGLTDSESIREAAWRANEGICVVIPEARLVLLHEQDDALAVEHSFGTFTMQPTSVPLPDFEFTGEVTRPDAPGDPAIACLDTAVGRPCSWAWISIPDVGHRGRREWFAVGAPGAVPERALSALATQMTHVSLALGFTQLHHQLSAQATQDPLTNLRNRASFLELLTTSLGPDASGPTSVLFVDLDDFKEVNDLFGHQTGDRLLSEVARCLREASGESAECARIGGDEFGVLLPDAGADEASTTAHRIAQRLGDATHPNGGPLHIGACIGVATSEGGVDAEDLVHRADVAMYAAKSAGKGRIATFDLSLPRRDVDQAVFERLLSSAARAGEMVVHYQPVIDLPEGRCTGIEALVRWQHPERGLIGPTDFISTAERTGAIRSIGAAVLRQAAWDTARWRREFPESPLDVHVNISALQLEDDDLLTLVNEVLEDTGLEPESLVLEVTESLALSSRDAVRRLNTLADHGITLAIDDFGTGYSALQTLRSLPIRIVKIDRSFVAGSSHNAEDRAVTEAIVQMAGQLGMRTVAEGVEELRQEAFLTSIGATGAQGYLYRSPGTATEFAEWFTRHLDQIEGRTQTVADPRTVAAGTRAVTANAP